MMGINMYTMNKYYVGARHIGTAIGQKSNASCTHLTLEGAIEEAKDKVRRGEISHAVVVKIVAIIREEHPPVAVEMVE